ncbi:MAG: fibronectin type III domain-containing protein [Thermodesulfobacteriota bacterium]
MNDPDKKIVFPIYPTPYSGVSRFCTCLLLIVLLVTGCGGGSDTNTGPIETTCQGYFDIFQMDGSLESMYNSMDGIFEFSDYEANIGGGFDGWYSVSWENHTTSESGVGTIQQGIRTICAPIFGGCIDTNVERWEATVPIVPGDNDVTFYGNGCREVIFTHLPEHTPKVKSFDAVLNPEQLDMSGLFDSGGLAATITADYGRDIDWLSSYRSVSASAVSDHRHAAISDIAITDFLLPGLTHYFRMTISNDLGDATSNTIAIIPPVDDPNQTQPYLYENGSASFITSDSARVSAMVLGNGAQYTAFVEYSENPDFIGFQESTRNINSDVLDSYAGENWALSSLTPNTKYHYRFVAYNSGGTSVVGYKSFTTAP